MPASRGAGAATAGGRPPAVAIALRRAAAYNENRRLTAFPSAGRAPLDRRTERRHPGAAAAAAFRPLDHHRAGDEDLLSRLRHERDRQPRDPGSARRPQAGAPAHPLRHARDRQHARQGLPQIRASRRRRDGQIPSARRQRDLRRPRAHGPAVLDVAAAAGRAGQFRLDGRRQPGRHALHRGPDGQAGGVSAGRHRQGHRRLPAELRRQGPGALRPAGAVSEHAGQRRRRHRGRHGHQHPAAQSRRGDRRDAGADRGSRSRRRGADGVHPGARFPDRRADPRPLRRAQGVS